MKTIKRNVSSYLLLGLFLVLTSLQMSCGVNQQAPTSLTETTKISIKATQTSTPNELFSSTPQNSPSSGIITIENLNKLETISKWEVGPNNQEAVLQNFIIDIAWSPNSSEFAVSAYKDNKGGIEVFKINKQERMCFFEDVFRSSLKYSPEDGLLAGSRLSPSYITIWNTNTCETIQEIGSSDCVPGRYLAYSLDGKTIVTAYDIGKGPFETIIDFWDVETGQCINEFQSVDGIITSLEIPRYNNFLITTFIRMEDDPSKQVLLMDLDSNEVLCAIPGIMVAFNQENDVLTVLDNDYRRISIWEAKTCNMLRSFQTEMDVVSFDVDPSGTLLAVGGDRIQLWDISGEKIQEIDEITKYIENLSFSPDGKYILTASSSHSGMKSVLTLWGISQ